MPPTVNPRKFGFEEPHEALHKIRITLPSESIDSLEQVCGDLVHVAREKMLKMKWPFKMPTKVLRITTRKSPCGEGTNISGRLELRVHKRVIDLHISFKVVKQITSITIEPGVEVEVTIAEP